MTDHTTAMLAIVLLGAVALGAAIVLAAQDPSVVSVPGVLGGLGALLVTILGLAEYRRRHP